jgi:hypothetical protein
MRLKLSSLCVLALSAFVSAAFAQDAAYLKQLNDKSAQMKRCAEIARQLEKIPVPPNHAEAKNVAASNALVKSTVAPVIDPVHANFEATVKRMDQDFAKCGGDLFRDLGQVESKLKPFMEQVKAKKPAEAEMKAISQTLGGYMSAKEDLQAAVELLSKDKQMEAYVGETLTKQYLNQKY